MTVGGSVRSAGPRCKPFGESAPRRADLSAPIGAEESSTLGAPGDDPEKGPPPAPKQARLRQEPALAGAVLVALTGWGQEEDRRRTREAGFDHHLVKPASPDTLQRLLAELRPPAR